MHDYPKRDDVEKMVIGCMLLEERAVDTFASQGGRVDWFLGAKERKAAQAIMMRYESGQHCSNALAISSDTKIDTEHFEHCIDLVTTVAHTGYYVEVLKGYADIDSLHNMADHIRNVIAKASPEKANEAKSSVEAELHRALVSETADHKTLKEAAHEWLDEMQDESRSVFMDWPVECITHHVGRIQREMIWIVAQPSVGKTAIILQWVACLASAGHMTSILSLESKLRDIMPRVLMQRGIDVGKIRCDHPDESEIKHARQEADKLSDLVRIHDKPMTIDQIYAWGRAEKRKGSKLLIIDNTRHVRMGTYNSRIDMMADMSVRLKHLRDDTGLPVVVLHHSNSNDDVSWSSDVRRDADILIFLREDEDKTIRPNAENPDGTWCVRFDVEKHREGRKGLTMRLRFRKTQMWFEKWEDVYYGAH